MLDKDTPLEGVSKRSRIKDAREWDAELLITTTVPAAVWGCVLLRPYFTGPPITSAWSENTSYGFP